MTPHDYQPPGFKEGENSMLVFQKEPVNLTMGEVVTPFHTLKLDVTTERERLEQVLFELYGNMVNSRFKFNIYCVYGPETGNLQYIVLGIMSCIVMFYLL